MTSQQKDAVTNKIMIYITTAFAGTVVWYLLFSLLKSSLYLTGNLVIIALALLGIASGIFFFNLAKKRGGNFRGYAWMSLIIAALSLLLNAGYYCSLIGIDITLFAGPFGDDITRYQAVLITSYIILAIAIIWNVVLILKKPPKQETPKKTKGSSHRK